jgi:hypothetical protein
MAAAALYLLAVLAAPRSRVGEIKAKLKPGDA